VTGAPSLIAVLGAGTMGAGIAQLGCLGGMRTRLYDPVSEARERGAEGLRAQLVRGAERGRWSAEDAEAAAGRLEVVDSLDALAGCELVIEAAPESLELKRELFGQVAEACGEDCVLATNTSSLLVTAIAAGVPAPGRVVGMHFFNPPPVMQLLEVVAGERSAEPPLAVARATGEAMGKRVIEAADGPGFLVNRCGRPFSLEAERLVEERIATTEEVDRICRLGGGFRMGPFELRDLVGVDVSLDVARSFYEQSFHEPRWRPSQLMVRMVAAGRLGRKTAHGFYRYGDGPHRPEDPEPPAAGGGDGPVAIAGDGPLAGQLADLARAAGWEVDARGGDPLTLQLGGDARALLCARGSLAALDERGGAVGFHALPPLADARLVELTRGPGTPDAVAERAERFFTSLGRHVAWVGDAPGLVLGRIVCQLFNEAAFAVAAGVGSPEDVDDGMVLGLSHPRGPVAWAGEIGLEHVLAVLDGLAGEYREERYRAAPLLRRMAAAARHGAPATWGA
jgi:3-hydroxybutyryl-CoA dehydrogenase